MVEQDNDYERRRRRLALQKESESYQPGDRVYVKNNTSDHPFKKGEALIVDHVACYALYCSNYKLTKVGYIYPADVERERSK